MYRRLYFISLCVIIFTACGSSSAPKICTQNSECPETAPVCNIETGKCEAATTDDNPDTVPGADEDEKNDSSKTVTDEDSVDVEPTENQDSDNSDTTPEQNDKDTDSVTDSDDDNDHADLNDFDTDDIDIIPDNDDSGDSASDEDGVDDGDSPNEPDDDNVYSDCTISSTEPCYTTCSGDNDEYFAWLNGELVNKKCKDNTCAVSGKKIGVEPDTCERYTTPPESCNPETSTMLCSPDGQSVWSCDSTDYVYYDYSCDAETEHCVQCQNKAGCISVENCTKDSTKACNSVCNAEGDGYYLWDNNIGVINLHICPKNDCIHVCGTAECKLGTGYHSGDTCEESSFKYCTADGAFAFTCQDGHINQKICKNNDCVYDANSNEIISCTSE